MKVDFIQCRDEDEIEDVKNAHKIENAFITCNHQIHRRIEFWDAEMMYELNADTINKLFRLQTHIEMVVEGNGLPFDQVVDEAKELKLAFDRALEAIKYEPLERKRHAKNHHDT